MVLGLFALLSIVYIGQGLLCLYRVITRWGSLWDETLTPEDLKLARAASFYVLVPPTVALHELGHAALVWAQGLEVVDWTFLGYMGTVSHRSAGPLGDFAIASAGNLVTLAIGVGCLFFGIERPGHPVRNVLAIELGRQSCFLVLVFYPLLCLTFPGDFATIYDFRDTPIASGVAAAFHGAVLLFGYGWVWKRRWKSRANLLSSLVAPRVLELERRVARDPGDLVAARELGILCQAVQDDARAVTLLEGVVRAGLGDALTRLAYGRALLATHRLEEGIVTLEGALEGLLRPEHRIAAEVPLIEALIEAGREDEARVHLDRATRAHPDLPSLRALSERMTRPSHADG